MTSEIRVLWLEDQVGTIKGTMRSARRHDFEVVLVSNSKDAVYALKQDKFHLMIVDYQIPSEANLPAIKGEGLTFIRDVLDNEIGLSDLRNRILLLTAQLASYRKAVEIREDDDFEVMEKPGSHLKVLKWMETVARNCE